MTLNPIHGNKHGSREAGVRRGCAGEEGEEGDILEEEEERRLGGWEASGGETSWMEIYL